MSLPKHTRIDLVFYYLFFFHSKNAGLFNPNFGSNMDKPKRWVKNVFKKYNPMVGFKLG